MCCQLTLWCEVACTQTSASANHSRVPLQITNCSRQALYARERVARVHTACLRRPSRLFGTRSDQQQRPALASKDRPPSFEDTLPCSEVQLLRAPPPISWLPVNLHGAQPILGQGVEHNSICHCSGQQSAGSISYLQHFELRVRFLVLCVKCSSNWPCCSRGSCCICLCQASPFLVQPMLVMHDILGPPHMPHSQPWLNQQQCTATTSHSMLYCSNYHRQSHT